MAILDSLQSGTRWLWQKFKGFIHKNSMEISTYVNAIPLAQQFGPGGVAGWAAVTDASTDAPLVIVWGSYMGLSQALLLGRILAIHQRRLIGLLRDPGKNKILLCISTLATANITMAFMVLTDNSFNGITAMTGWVAPKEVQGIAYTLLWQASMGNISWIYDTMQQYYTLALIFRDNPQRRLRLSLQTAAIGTLSAGGVLYMDIVRGFFNVFSKIEADETALNILSTCTIVNGALLLGPGVMYMVILQSEESVPVAKRIRLYEAVKNLPATLGVGTTVWVFGPQGELKILAGAGSIAFMLAAGDASVQLHPPTKPDMLQRGFRALVRRCRGNQPVIPQYALPAPFPANFIPTLAQPATLPPVSQQYTTTPASGTCRTTQEAFPVRTSATTTNTSPPPRGGGIEMTTLTH